MKISEILTRHNLEKTLLIISIILSVWLIIHILALTGLLLIILYIIIWIRHHGGVVCLKFWLQKDRSTYCSWCDVSVPKDIIHSPKNKRSVFINCLVILFFTLVSIGYVFIEYSIIKYFSENVLNQAPRLAEISLTSPPMPGDYAIGEIIPMPIVVENNGTAVNAVQADIAFDPKSFEVVDILTDQSFANIFIQKEINNIKGYARLAGGLPNPGYSGKRGIFGVVLLKTRQSGKLMVNYLPTSRILANDGKPTNLLKETVPVYYAVRNESIDNEKAIEQEKEYTKRRTATVDNQFKLYGDSAVLGAATSKELENAVVVAARQTKGPLVLQFDQFILRLWLGRILSNI